MTGEYDLRRVWDGVDPSTGEKISWLDRVGAGGMMVLGITPVGKLAKVAKGAKMTAKAVESAKAAEAAKSIRAAENYKTILKDKIKYYLVMVHIEKRNVMPEFLILLRIKNLFMCMMEQVKIDG